MIPTSTIPKSRMKLMATENSTGTLSSGTIPLRGTR